MRKIPTVFRRDPNNMRNLLQEVNDSCKWVLDGEGIATRKWDGTCVKMEGGKWYARHQIKKDSKSIPANFVSEEFDPQTGKEFGWVPAEQSSFYKYLLEAVEGKAEWEEGTYELCGPKINGNPEGLVPHMLLLHGDYKFDLDPLDLNFEDLRQVMDYLSTGGWEGLVWHHPDGRMAKLKVRDFQ